MRVCRTYCTGSGNLPSYWPRCQSSSHAPHPTVPLRKSPPAHRCREPSWIPARPVLGYSSPVRASLTDRTGRSASASTWARTTGVRMRLVSPSRDAAEWGPVRQFEFGLVVRRTLQLLPCWDRPSYAGWQLEVHEGMEGQLLVRYRGETIPTQEAPSRPSLLHPHNGALPYHIELERGVNGAASHHDGAQTSIEAARVNIGAGH